MTTDNERFQLFDDQVVAYSVLNGILVGSFIGGIPFGEPSQHQHDAALNQFQNQQASLSTMEHAAQFFAVHSQNPRQFQIVTTALAKQEQQTTALAEHIPASQLVPDTLMGIGGTALGLFAVLSAARYYLHLHDRSSRRPPNTSALPQPTSS